MEPISSPDVLIVGGGVMGLAIARTLTREGATALVLERDRPMRGATGAAGGMLAPLGEAPDPGPFLALGLEALAAWPRFAAALIDASGVDIGFRPCGQLLVASSGPDVERLRARHAWQTAVGHDARWLDRIGIGEIEPRLDSRWRAGIHLPGHARVDPRRLGRALVEAARREGVRVMGGSDVVAIEIAGGRTRGVTTADGFTWDCGQVVVAAGAWSGRIAGLPRPLPVRPVRGQMLAIEVDDPPVAGLVVGPGAYLIPRDGAQRGRIAIGASMEDAGFQVTTDTRTIAALREAAEALVPALRAGRETERWAGLRPGTPDDLPLLGADPEIEGLVYATGHHRNGILLAPVTATLVSDAVAGRPLDPRWSAFDPARFGTGSSANPP